MATDWEAQGWTKVGEVDVDSCSIWIGDPAYAPDTTQIKDSALQPFHEHGYAVISGRSPVGSGFWSYTLEGDGTYPVYAQIHEWQSSDGRTFRRPTRLMIDFDIYGDE